MTTGERIRLLREKKGISQSDLSIAVGYKTRSSITKIEKGESDPPQNMLIKIANALEVTPAALLGDSSAAEYERLDARRPSAPRTLEARIVSYGMDSLPKEEREKILSILQTMYNNNPGLFKEDRQDDA